MSNFEFLNKLFPILSKLGMAAETYLYTDTDACLYKLGKLSETTINEMIRLDNIEITAEENSMFEKINVLRRNGLLPSTIDDILYKLRKSRNSAVHTNEEIVADCTLYLEMAHTLCTWFMQTYGEWNYQQEVFVVPVDNRNEPDYKEIAAKQEAEIERLLAVKQEDSKVAMNYKERAKRANFVARSVVKSERETRAIIDEQLRKVGFDADTQRLCYSKGTRPEKGRNIAIAEWPTNSKVTKRGFADYALFVGEQLVAVIEAKAEDKTVYNVIDYQCNDYASMVREADAEYVVNQWQEYQVPFAFATNSKPYCEGYEIKSGLWFRDLRKNSNLPKPLKGWISPQGFIELLSKDEDEANKRLSRYSMDILRDKEGLNLREYQINAIEAVESAVHDGKKEILLSMATGTGKTRTILGMIYRFIKTDRFKRALFLVDRTALGEQAQDVFEEVKIEDFLTLDNQYDIKKLEDNEIDPNTRIQVATVQSMVKRILYNNSDTMPSVTDYDLIVVDEAHRGYILDKEMGESELLYRDELDYVSKYRTVIEFFDATKVALTATPALHTTEIFGKPVFEYSYSQAVIDGYLVDHDVPHDIGTKLKVDGIIYQKGEVVPIYDPITGEITNSDELEDELEFDVEQFNRMVITESFNRTVLTEIAKDLDPEGEGKTLIFAVTDDHADMIVRILRDIYKESEIDHDAIMKITGSVGGGNKKKVLEAIKRFKNEKYPNIVVTVDLLTTGIDVPEICNIVFMRRIKSRILFEQMLGRATRLCDEIGKTHFEIYDPVGVYESLQPVSTMKPVVASQTTTFVDLIEGLNNVDDEAHLEHQIDLIIAKMQRHKHNMTNVKEEQFKDLSGGKTTDEFIQELKNLTPSNAKSFTLEKCDALFYLGENGKRPRKGIVISDKEDELLYHKRGYGKGEKPQDYIEEFRKFINENMEKIEALKLVCTRPQELTREALKSLKLELERNGFKETFLNTALTEIKNEDIAADIISIIRAEAVGSKLLSHEERIKNAVVRLKKNHKFSKQEINWLDNIEKFLITETVLNEETFNLGAFRDKGGYIRADKIFNGKLKEIIIELNQYLYDDGGKAA